MNDDDDAIVDDNQLCVFASNTEHTDALPNLERLLCYFSALLVQSGGVPGISLTLCYVCVYVFACLLDVWTYMVLEQTVFILHPTLGLRTSLLFTCPLFFPYIWKRVQYMSRIEFLDDFIPRKLLSSSPTLLPEFVHDYDKELEFQPLIEYGRCRWRW